MDFITLIFLVVAVIIFFRLRSVLGSRTGHERNPLEQKWPVTIKNIKKPERDLEGEKKALSPAKSETTFDNRLEGVETGTPLAASLKTIADADPSFRVSHFLKGACAAYELIVTAFAKSDQAKLRPLLSAEMLANFDAEIAAREKKNESVDFHFIGLTKAEIKEAVLKNGVAQIGVFFRAKLVQATRNAKGEVVEGDATAVDEISDIWTFERRLSSRDPNWKLVEVEDA